MAMYSPWNIIREVDMSVIAEIRNHSIINYIQMNDDRPFFNAEINDELVNSLDSLAFAELLQVLQLNFQQEHQQLIGLSEAKTGLLQEIKTGEGNLTRLAALSVEHQR